MGMTVHGSKTQKCVLLGLSQNMFGDSLSKEEDCEFINTTIIHKVP